MSARSGASLGVRYVLEGSVRRGGDRIRISAQLIDAATGAHRWAEHYDRKLEDVFAVQDEVVRTIVAILAAHVRKAETERTRAKPPNSWQAYDYYLQAAEALRLFRRRRSAWRIFTKRGVSSSSRLPLMQTTPAPTPSWRSTHEAAWVNPLDSDFLNPGALDQAHQFARKAVQLDPNLPLAHAVPRTCPHVEAPARRVDSRV